MEEEGWGRGEGGVEQLSQIAVTAEPCWALLVQGVWTVKGCLERGSWVGAGEGKVQMDICIGYDLLQYMVCCLGSDCKPVALNLTSFVRNRAVRHNCSTLDNYYVQGSPTSKTIVRIY